MLESRSTSNSGVIHIDIPNIRQILKIAFSVTVPVVLLLLPTILFQLISWRCWRRRKKNTPSKPPKMTNTHKTLPKKEGKGHLKQGNCEFAKPTTQLKNSKNVQHNVLVLLITKLVLWCCFSLYQHSNLEAFAKIHAKIHFWGTFRKIQNYIVC